MPKPNLTFFCELDSEALPRLFEGRFVIDDLLNLEAAVSLGIMDLSDERAEIVKRLNEAGVPVIAWLLLPKEEGYWFNVDNHEQAAARYVQFKAWTDQHDLKWSGVGLDIEMDIRLLQNMMNEDAGSDLPKKMFQKFGDRNRVQLAQRTYQALIDLIRADGYPVESYQLPLINEERRGKSTVLQRAMGLVDVETDREVLMLYSSFLRPNGDAVLWSYAPQTDSVGVGSTGGGVEVEGVIDIDPLSWEEFSRDLRLCVVQEKPVHIFSLEGCVEQEFLSRLNTFGWDDPVDIPDSINGVKAIRTGISALLWVIERPWVILLGLATLIGLGFLFKQSKNNK